MAITEQLKNLGDQMPARTKTPVFIVPHRNRLRLRAFSRRPDQSTDRRAAKAHNGTVRWQAPSAERTKTQHTYPSETGPSCHRPCHRRENKNLLYFALSRNATDRSICSTQKTAWSTATRRCVDGLPARRMNSSVVSVVIRARRRVDRTNPELMDYARHCRSTTTGARPA